MGQQHVNSCSLVTIIPNDLQAEIPWVYHNLCVQQITIKSVVSAAHASTAEIIVKNFDSTQQCISKLIKQLLLYIVAFCAPCIEPDFVEIYYLCFSSQPLCMFCQCMLTHTEIFGCRGICDTVYFIGISILSNLAYLCVVYTLCVLWYIAISLLQCK